MPFDAELEVPGRTWPARWTGREKVSLKLTQEWMGQSYRRVGVLEKT